MPYPIGRPIDRTLAVGRSRLFLNSLLSNGSFRPKEDITKKDARPKPGAPQRDEVCPRRVVCLDCLEVQRARPSVVGARLIRETLADRRKTVLAPRDRALFEANEIKADFRLDFAVTLDRVE